MKKISIKIKTFIISFFLVEKVDFVVFDVSGNDIWVIADEMEESCGAAFFGAEGNYCWDSFADDACFVETVFLEGGVFLEEKSIE